MRSAAGYTLRICLFLSVETPTKNLGFCLFLQLRRPNGKIMYALIPVPRQTERFIRLPGPEIRFLLLEDLIGLFLDHLFPTFRAVRSG